jgi:hypothetical protein
MNGAWATTQRWSRIPGAGSAALMRSHSSMMTLKSPGVSEWFSLRQPASATRRVPARQTSVASPMIGEAPAVNSPMPTIYNMSAP